ncbi:11-beta-hydroxysteroid dehydrogenase A-like [Argentina anserina]|uniref:11-beta-hydroxysteroid dehydrogenase A-like n=1 Tax=Argentina anserina TaxID=57926 RepID=UPI0021763589|nr:11-beta-hydroxysteroid dehydrogenase A-like [Potentilla anserina]
MMLSLIHTFLNLSAPPFTFFSLLLLLPPLYFLKLFTSLLSTIFSENVSGKVVLITGASSGIGEHLAYEYARRGARLALVGRRENALREVVDRAAQCGSPDVIMIGADVSKAEDCKRLVDETINHFGRLDHLVNNAGITACCMLEDCTDITNFRSVMDTNFWGSVYVTHFAAPHLRDCKGRIVAISSVNAWLPVPRMGIYNASKAAVLSMFETLRVELGPEVYITIVTPGYIESEMNKGKYLSTEGRMTVDQEMRDVQVIIPVERVEDCANAIVNGVCRGQRCLTEPAWYKAIYMWKVFCPELLEWGYRFLYMARPGAPAKEAPGKKILDYTGVKNVLYPESLHNPEIKTD